ncbi:thioredoxin domain-containing protein [Trichonephila clavata]|uniref:Thioredoxin domain-containing protein n=1 Tax=Trichonephila clavata TaxID=2740835 RepID=A0A8X6LQR4_TRICU|nr:thioredoxin domain-containing protein [Trichonephila clavata]
MDAFAILLNACILGIVYGFAEESKMIDEVKEFDNILKEENALAVLFTQACCICTECVEAEVLLGGMSKELEDNLAILVLRVKEQALKSRYGIKKVPALAFIRDNKTAIYDGQFEFDALYYWMQDNRQPLTVDLDDSNFEHLTQAATGATTGDWLVVFHDGTCCKNRELIHLEDAGIKLRGRVNVASLDTRIAPETVKRFKVSSCPHVIFFRHQKLYRFSLPDITSKTLRKFSEGFYKNSKAEVVPLPASFFDKLTDKTVEFIDQHQLTLIIVLVGTTACTALYLIYTLVKPNPHKKTE